MLPFEIRKALRFYLLISAVLVTASLVQIPAFLELSRLAMPSDMTSVQVEEMSRTMLRAKVIVSFLVPFYHLVLIFAQALIVWAILTAITGTSVKVKAALAAAIYPFAVVALSRLIESLVLLARTYTGTLGSAPRNPLGFGFVTDSLSLSPIVTAMISKMDLLTVAYVALLPFVYHRLFGGSRTTSVVVVLTLSIAWFYLVGTWSVFTQKLQPAP